MTHKICFKATTKEISVLPLASEVPVGFTNIGNYIHDAEGDPLGSAVSHVLYHHIRDALYPLGVQDMAYINVSFTREIESVPVIISCAYPLAPDDDLRAFVWATVSLTGTGDDGKTVSWTPSGLDQAASASSGDAATTGSILMGTDTVWFESSAAQGAYNHRLSAAITDGAGTLITKLTGYSMSAISYDDHILTIGFNPDGSVVRKANGVENNMASGGPVTGEYFAPYILINDIGNGVASSVTLRTSATEMQYAGTGKDICGNAL